MIEFPRAGLCVNRLKEERFRTQYLGVILNPVRKFFGDLMRKFTPFSVADIMEIYDGVSEARSLSIGALNPGAFVKHLERALASETVSDTYRANSSRMQNAILTPITRIEVIPRPKRPENYWI